jgi:hypothetical protein
MPDDGSPHAIAERNASNNEVPGGEHQRAGRPAPCTRTRCQIPARSS